jgi:hypothetical protein
MRRVLTLLAFAGAASLAGCGGSSHQPNKVVTAKQESPYASDRTAEVGHVAAAHNTGTVTASLGFDLGRDGFSFENYGFIAGVEIDAHAMRELFGDRVCAGAASDSCTLTPAAQQWAAQTDAAMAGGHCFGFSVTALRFFTHKLGPNQFGGPTTFSLSFSPQLQSELAYGWAMQELPAVRQSDISRTPTGTVQFLEQALANHGGEVYTIGIFKPDGSDGHAVTPIAIENLGRSQYLIDIYDNNYPNTPRAISVNTTNDSWTYNAAPNPSDAAGVYSGQGKTNPMNLVPLSAGLQTQPCPFCGSAGATRGTLRVSLGGNPVDHGHLLITTAGGKRIGYVGGRFVNEIKGAGVFQPYLNQDWNANPEPIYELPASGPVRVTLDGGSATGADPASVHVTGPGFGATVSDLRPSSGFSDRILVGAGGAGLSVHAARSTAGPAPTLALARNTGQSGSELTATPAGLRAGESLGIVLAPPSNRLSVTSSGTARPGPVALSLRRVGPTGTQSVHTGVALSSGRTETLSLGLYRIG